jgi:cell division protein ZapE
MAAPPGTTTLLTPSEAYASGVAAGHWQADPAQQAALSELDRLQAQLLAAQPESLLEKFAARFREPVAVPGLYLWGRVGRGKTFLADLLFEQLGALPRRRWHFHRFMGEVHARLRALPDTADTLSVVAKDLAADIRLLLLDEFFVGDIGDAMILGRLLEQLLARGVTLVTTSNIPPQDLYRDGLQRASFLPCIALLESHCHVLRLDSAQDYRLRQLTRAATYLTPLDAASEQALAQHFERLAGHSPRDASPLRLNDRAIAVKAQADGVAWFEFAELCAGPRAAADYIEIARDFHTVLVSNVPRLDRDNEDAALRFVQLIDEFYDRHVNLLLSAAVDPLSLYQGQRHPREFERTSSRLIEMQSAEYLAREHRP